MFLSAENYSDIKSVKAEYPGAADIKEVDGGWMAFDTAKDHEMWKNQK